MNKVAGYLQEHIRGEVAVHPTLLDAMSCDASVLTISPEMIIYPRVTNDIRKVARFAWQLAEKGHLLPLTPRGMGADETGAAIGPGAIVHFPAHMNAVLEFDPKQKLVRVQPGITLKALNDALALHGVAVPVVPFLPMQTTVGGAIANNTGGLLAGVYGTMRDWVDRLEVVLANGDVLQTERISRRELNKRKGLQTFEGEIYRSLDNLIEDNRQLIDEKIGTDSVDASGYSAIAKVKQRDGSFDLTPLFTASQGTLGIVSETILKCEFVSMHRGIVAAAFTSEETARDALDQLRQLEPSYLEYYDGELFELAASRGKRFGFFREIDGMIAAVVVVGLHDFGERARHKKLKKIAKYLDSLDVLYKAADGEEAEDLADVLEVTRFLLQPDAKELSAPPLFDGVYIPPERFEEFSAAVDELATKHHIALPIHYRALESTVFTRPQLQLHRVGDKQKLFKLLDEYAVLVAYHGGVLVATDGEGRTKARFAHAQLDDDVKELYAAVKAIFDPYTILNPGVKQVTEVRQLVQQLRRDYDTAAFKDLSLYN